VSTPAFTPQLRPLSIGEMLDAGFKLFRQRFGTLMVCVLVPVVPLSIISTILVGSVDDTAFDVNASASDSSSGDVANLIDNLLSGAAAAIAIAACFKVISSAYLGERTDASASLRYGLSRLFPLIVAYIMMSIGIGLGLVALVIPGVFLAIKWSMTFPAIVAERAGPFAAMGRSWELTRGHWWRTFGALLVVVLISFVLAFAILIALGAAVASSDSISEVAFAVLITVVTIIVLAVLYPLTASIVTVVYYDLRVRNEGFDLQLLARGVGADATRFETAPERPGPPSSPPSPSGGGFAPPG
jgi:Membrane domain of glycerophosphoryl diester phosphodiesterase